MRLIISAALMLFAANAAIWAQQAHGPAQPRNPSYGVNSSQAQTLEGVVAAVTMGYGAQYPSITVNHTVIQTAPIWYFLEAGFELKAGDKVKVTAAPSLRFGDSLLYAIEIVNGTTGSTILLRDPAGTPLWSRSAAGREAPTRSTAACVDPASIRVVAGTVEKATAGIGIQMPAILLKPAEGPVLNIKVGPERVLLLSDFELREGDTLTVKLALLSCTDEYVALQLTNSAGVVLTLRNDDGTPAWPR